MLNRLRVMPRLGQSTIAAVLAAVLLASFDLTVGLGRTTQPLSADRLAVIGVAHVTTLLALSLLLVGGRAIMRELAVDKPWLPLVGALDGSALFYLLIHRQDYATFDPSIAQRCGLLGAAMLLSAGLTLAARRWPLLAFAGAITGTIAIGFVMHRLSFRSLPYLRLGLTLALITCLARIIAAMLPPYQGAVRSTLLAIVVALVVSVPILRGSAQARSFLFQFSSHAGVVMRLPMRGMISDRRSAHRSARCQSAGRAPTPTVRSARSGSLHGADILMVSLDALRWDHGFALKDLFDALGPHVRFMRAVSPAPNTKHALAAVIRGVPAREVPFSIDVLEQGVRHDAPPTLAALLAPAGYRTVHIPTQRYFDPRVGITTGFEMVRADKTSIFVDDGPGHGVTRAAPVLRKALSLAKATKKPLLLWTHLMETHAPYRHGKRVGPPTSEGQVKAIKALSRSLAQFVPRFRKARDDRPLIVVLFGDHGEEFGEHGGQQHGATAYAEVARVAFAIAATGLPAAQVEAPVSTSASVATVLDLIGAPIPASVSIPSLLPCVANAQACPVVADTQQLKEDGWVSYTGARYRLAFGPRVNVAMAFDSDSDPYDRFDLGLSGVAPSPELRAFQASVEAYDRAHCAASPIPNE